LRETEAKVAAQNIKISTLEADNATKDDKISALEAALQAALAKKN
jgi:chaperonin cofactor prefoldin